MSRVRVTLWQNDDVALAKRLAEIRRNARSILSRVSAFVWCIGHLNTLTIIILSAFNTFRTV